MQIIDEGFFIKLLPNEGMILTDVSTETMRAEEIYLGKPTVQIIIKIFPLSPKQI